MKYLHRALTVVSVVCLWTGIVAAQGADIPIAITSDELGNVYVTGASMDKQGTMGMATVMFDAAGNRLETFDVAGDGSGPAMPAGVGIVDSTIVVSGTVPAAESGFDIVTAGFMRPPLVSVNNAPLHPASLTLDQSYPNPVHGGNSALIRYGIPERGHVRLVIIDMLGREIEVLADGMQERGSYRVQFAPSTLPSGSYLYMLTTSSSSEVRKLTVVR